MHITRVVLEYGYYVLYSRRVYTSSYIYYIKYEIVYAYYSRVYYCKHITNNIIFYARSTSY